MPSNNTIPTTVDEERSFAPAYVESHPDRDALRPDDIVRVNLDVPSAVATVLGALPEIMALRAAVENDLPDFDRKNFDRLQTYTMALSHAFAQSKSSTPAADNLPDLNVEGTTLRDNFLADMQTLTRRSLINADAIKSCKGYTGYKNVATELQVLVTVARGSWDRIKDKCGISLEELDRADKVAAHMLRLVGLREQAPQMIAAAAEERDRAFTLFVRSYDQVRRAVLYLRWDEDDADEIAPSLYAGRNRAEIKKEDQPVVVAPVAPIPTTPAPVNPNVPTPATPAVPTGGPFVD
jgi:hypothetical protein